MQKVIELCPTPIEKAEPLAKAGSNRQYYRLYAEDGSTFIGVHNDNVEENQCFIYLAKHFKGKGLSVPQIIAVSADNTRYVQEDLGKIALYDYLKMSRETGIYEAQAIDILENTIRQLVHIQVEGAQEIDWNQCLQPQKFDERAAMFDLNYFKYMFLRTSDLPFDEVALQDDLEMLARDLVKCGNAKETFLYRDFQSRNVMIWNDKPYFIDFQGGRKGPVHYDLASFLYQASAKYPDELKKHLCHTYTNELQKFEKNFNESKFLEQLQLFVFFRTLQVLGAYGLRGRFERKEYFIQSIPLALENLRKSLDAAVCHPYPYLKQILYRLIEKELQHT